MCGMKHSMTAVNQLLRAACRTQGSGFMAVTLQQSRGHIPCAVCPFVQFSRRRHWENARYFST